MSEATITRKAIAYELKKLTMEKSFEKISISDITAACGLNRQTFYYHFEDKYELVRWIYYQELIIDLVTEIDLFNWHEHLEAFLKRMKAESWFYINTIKSQREYLEEYLFRITRELFLDAIVDLDEDGKLSEGDKRFFAEFFSHGICGIVFDWVLSGMKEEPESLAEHSRKMVMNSKKIAYRRYMEEKEKSKEGD